MSNLLPNSDSAVSKLDPADLLNAASATIKRNELIAVISDIDLSVSTGGIRGEEDPRLTRINPQSAKALKTLEDSGQIIGFISNRSGSQIARMAYDAGIKKARIIGTYGYEIYLTITHQSIIDERLLPYQTKITEILTALENHALYFFKYNKKLADLSEIAIPYLEETVVLERKAICPEYPKGIAMLFNLNMISPARREIFVEEMINVYSQEIKKVMSTHHMLASALMKVWGLNKEGYSASSNNRYTLKFEPILKQSKAYGMMKLWNLINTNTTADRKIGLIIYSGDSDQDAAAMKAVRQIINFHNTQELNSNPLKAFNIWVRPDHLEKDAQNESDIIVNGVIEYAQLLTNLAKCISY